MMPDLPGHHEPPIARSASWDAGVRYPRPRGLGASAWSTEGAGLVFGGLCGSLFLTGFLVSGSWAGFHAVLLGLVGILVALRPAKVPVPTLWWILACAFLVGASAAFLPARWFPMPEWRDKLEALGVDTGRRVAIQSQMALEMLMVLAITLFTGLWMAGHRASPAQLRACALAFTLGVAVYALLARLAQGSPLFPGLLIAGSNFGFFPNRNHSSTYLSMGAVCGLGLMVQSLRERRFGLMAITLAATLVCLWAITFWSISRAGVLLTAIGAVGWIGLIGIRYIGRHGLWVIALIAITATGSFLLSESRVRGRIFETFSKAVSLAAESQSGSPADRLSGDAAAPLDFRIPIFRDTLAMIGDAPWTGFGAGQFAYVFPQYRAGSAVANDKDCLHPESDWLWVASETGVPATLFLGLLVVVAALSSLRGIRKGSDRALRAACLAGALLVPAHGLFDIPAHRITLAWTGCFLFAMSLQPVAVAPSAARWRRLGGRALATCLISLSALLTWSHWLGGPQAAITAADRAIVGAAKLHREDMVLTKAAEDRGEEHQPDPSEDKLEQALAILDHASRTVPLDRSIRRYQASFALYFDDKHDFVDRTFAVARVLDPSWVEGTMRQAEAWVTIDPARTIPLWEEALERARMMDRIWPDSPWSEGRIRDRIRSMAEAHPELRVVLGGPLD